MLLLKSLNIILVIFLFFNETLADGSRRNSRRKSFNENGPVYSFIKTDPQLNIIWGVRRYIQSKMSSFITANRHGYSIKFSPANSRHLLVASSQIYGSMGGGTLYFLYVDDDITEINKFEWTDGLFDVAWCKENNNFAMTASGDGTMQLWNLLAVEKNHKPYQIYGGHTREIYSLDWGGILNYNSILSSSWDNTIKLWDSTRSEAYQSYVGEESSLFYSSKYSPYIPHFFSSVSTNGKINLWNSLEFSGKPILSIRAHTDEALTCDWSKFNQWILGTGGADGMTLLWDIRNMLQPVQLVYDLKNGPSAVRRLQFSPFSENILATGNFDGSVKIWNTTTPQAPMERLENHEDACYGLDWNPNVRHQMADCGWDSKINVFTSECLKTY